MMIRIDKPVKVFSIAIITVAWLFWELWANFDSDPDTWPLTWVIVKYVPGYITIPAVLILALWLPWHFWTNYKNRKGRFTAAKNLRLQTARCLNCDHLVLNHNEDGCWFTTARSVGNNLVCVCKESRGAR